MKKSIRLQILKSILVVVMASLVVLGIVSISLNYISANNILEKLNVNYDDIYERFDGDEELMIIFIK